MLEWVVVIAAATWRVSSLLHTEAVFGWLRRLVGIEADEDGIPVAYPDSLICTLFECFWCMSLLVSLAMATILSWVMSDWLSLPVTWLASATGAIMIEKWIGRSKARW